MAWCPVYKAGSSVWMYVFAGMGGMLTPVNKHKVKHGLIQINELARKAYPKNSGSRENVEVKVYTFYNIFI